MRLKLEAERKAEEQVAAEIVPKTKAAEEELSEATRKDTVWQDAPVRKRCRRKLSGNNISSVQFRETLKAPALEPQKSLSKLCSVCLQR